MSLKVGGGASMSLFMLAIAGGIALAYYKSRGH